MTTFANRNSQIPLREIKKPQIEGHRSNDTTIGIGIKNKRLPVGSLKSLNL
jgi:hypothetical protein